MRRLPRWCRRVALCVVALAVLWLGGLAAFVASSLLPGTTSPDVTDAIVVVTGGRLRLETALELLAAGKAKKLFISGVNQRVERDELLRVLGPAAEREACCIVVGHAAADTRGNARESASWMRGEGYRSLRLVTSWYHMRRSLLEFGLAMPRITIIAHPVFAQHLEPGRWWTSHGALVLIIGEYHKFLAAWLRPWLEAVEPPPEREPGSGRLDANPDRAAALRRQ